MSLMFAAMESYDQEQAWPASIPATSIRSLVFSSARPSAPRGHTPSAGWLPSQARTSHHCPSEQLSSPAGPARTDGELKQRHTGGGSSLLQGLEPARLVPARLCAPEEATRLHYQATSPAAHGRNNLSAGSRTGKEDATKAGGGRNTASLQY
ncbi:unnamed protein product [Eretmochelys imbricata]